MEKWHVPGEWPTQVTFIAGHEVILMMCSVGWKLGKFVLQECLLWVYSEIYLTRIKAMLIVLANCVFMNILTRTDYIIRTMNT